MTITNNRNAPVRVTQWDQRTADLPIALAGANSPTTLYTYQAFDALQFVTDADGETTTMFYDGIGRKTQISNPSTGYKSFTYNAFDQVLSEADPLRANCYDYDVLGRPKTIKQSDTGDCQSAIDVTAFLYDDPTTPNSLGKLTSSFRRVQPGSSEGTTTTYRYEDVPQTGNNVGRLKSVTQQVSGTSSLTSSFDYYGPWLTGIHYPGPAGSALSVFYNYDRIGVPVAVFDSALQNQANSTGMYWQITAFDNGVRIASEQFGNNVVGSYSYFVPGSSAPECNNPAQNSCMPGSLRSETTFTASATAGVVYRGLNYSYDRGGNLKHRTEFALTGQVSDRYYVYDAYGRLTQQQNYDNAGQPAGSSSWSYTPAGDLLYQRDVNAAGTVVQERDYTYDFDNAHRHLVTSAGGQQFLHDAVGNQVRRTGTDYPQGQTIDYNEFNMPWHVQGNTQDGRDTYLEYNAAHQRVVKRGPEKTTIYMGDLYECDGPNPAAGATFDCTTHRYKIYGGGKLVAVVTRDAFDQGTTSFVHADRLGSSSLITDQNGNPVENRQFEAFGSSTVDFTATGINSGFTGQEHDAELGLINMGGRLYDPKLSRFITADPYVSRPFDPQGMNRFAYVQNNPINATDPSGFEDYGPDAPPSYPGGGGPTGGGGWGGGSDGDGYCSTNGSYYYGGSNEYSAEYTVDVANPGASEGAHPTVYVNSSSSTPTVSSGASGGTGPSPGAISQPANGAPAAPASTPSSQEGGPTGSPAAPPGAEGGSYAGPSGGPSGVSSNGNVSSGALSNPVGNPMALGAPGSNWAPGTTGAPSSAQPSSLGYRSSYGAGGGPSIAGLPIYNAAQGVNSIGQPLITNYEPSQFEQLAYSMPLVILTPAAMAELFGGAPIMYRAATGLAAGYVNGLATRQPGQPAGMAIGQALVGMGIGALSPFGSSVWGTSLNSMTTSAITQYGATGSVNLLSVGISGFMRFGFGYATGWVSAETMSEAWANGAARGLFGATMRIEGAW